MIARIATYGTLKRNRRASLEGTEGAMFVCEDAILNAQLWINKRVPYWPIITLGQHEVAVDVWAVTDELFQWIKRGEEANCYETVEAQLKSGNFAWTWWFDSHKHVSNVWQPVDVY